MPSSSSISPPCRETSYPPLPSGGTSRDLPPTPPPIAPGPWSPSQATPLPISKLPPLRLPSPSFQLLGAEMSWSEISRSHVSPSRDRFGVTRATVTPHTAISPALPALPALSPLEPQTDDRIRPVAKPPMRDSHSRPPIVPSRTTHPPSASILASIPPYLQLTSWLKPRFVLVVYVVSISVGLTIAGMLPQWMDRPDRSLTQMNCSEAILVDL